jgi:hypothetical protein
MQPKKTLIACGAEVRISLAFRDNRERERHFHVMDRVFCECRLRPAVSSSEEKALTLRLS